MNETEILLFRFGNDTQVSATNFLALTEWHLGEFERARQLIDESTRRANELGHVAAIASALFFRTVIESRRGDVPAARVAVESLRALTDEHSLKTYADLGRSVRELGSRQAILIQRRGRWGSKRRWRPISLWATRAARRRSTVCSQSLKPCGRIWMRALTTIDVGLAMAEETGEHFTDPYLHRLRGEFSAEATSRGPRSSRGSFPNRHRHCQGARRAGLCPPGLSLAREALPINRPPRRRPRHPRARARRLFADARNARDRRGAGPAGGYRGRRACEARINTAMGWLSCILSDA